MPLAADMSHWSGPLTDDEARCLRDRGYALVIANTHGPHTLQQLDAARRHGMRAHAYVYLYWRGNVADQVAFAVAKARDVAEMLWLDCEDDPAGLSPAVIRHAIDRAVAACAGMRCGIYTRRSWWRACTSDSDAWRHLPLWDADYDGQASFEGFAPYGGWARPWMKQFGGTQEVCGQSIDPNYYEEGRMYTDAEIDAKIGELIKALAAYTARSEQRDTELLGALIDHNKRLLRLERAPTPEKRDA